MAGQHNPTIDGFSLHDRCSRELASGFRNLRFRDTLEAEYRAHMREDQLKSTLVCIKFGLVVWMVFVVLDLFRLNLPTSFMQLDAQLWLLLAIRWGVLLIFVAGIIYTPRFKEHLGIIAFVLYCSLGIGTALTAQLYKVHGIPQAEIAQIIVIMVAFMPIGLVFYHALTAAALVALVTMVTGIMIHASSAVIGHLYLSLMLLLAIPVGAMGGYLREHADREQFLLRGMLERFAFYDPLTSLANRRLFEQHISTVLMHAARQREPVVYGIVDVDFFKQYNDHYGHAAGDIALQRVARVLADAAQRPMDMAARVGGEEFALLLYGTDLESARVIFEDMRDKITALAIPHEYSSVSTCLTLSAGVSQYRDTESVEQLLRRADLLLYQSKENGRDRATFA